MPRQPRLDIPGLLQHVIVRGIDRAEIFLDDEDRRLFVDRLSRLLVETGTDCYAWALIPNHFHLLLRCNRVELSRLMRRLLTSHAINFNHRHNRSGHLCQNRYKSIVCEEEPYFLELVRYIHLNPLRAGLVVNLDALDCYPWCGHAVLLGQGTLPGQVVDAVLERFGARLSVARQHYRQFVADGLLMGARPELVGGGQKRSQASGTASEATADFDDRVLGGSDFVQTLREDDLLRGRLAERMALAELQKGVAGLFDLAPAALEQRGRQNETSAARAVFCYLAVMKLQYSGAEVGRALGIGVSSVCRAVRRGEEMFRSRDAVRLWWMDR
ncbi:MAG: transposase [Desulfuromonadales bacterium]|nr:transposase [Desulfuromonadales bacterium]